ncbi:MAG: GTP cyclohydrolase I FolE [Acidobacteriota bacterium]|nr:GTP cyclohydrolase I FolE [Thermoanaerobaculaceae bacterium]
MEEHIKALLKFIDDNPEREELKETPRRVKESFLELTKGTRENIDEICKGAIFDEPSQAMVLVRDVSFYSLCEHHILPFFGRAHIAYIPNGKIIGLSKLPRIVEHYARRLQVQERMTQQIAETIQNLIKPCGLGVLIEATHLCMVMRGVQKEGSVAVTSALRGSFLRDERTRLEFLALIGRGFKIPQL